MLYEVITQNSISLYEKSDPNTTFELSTSHNILWVKADPDQLLSVFNNQFKNAIQAIPNNRKGVIKIAVSEEDNMAKITICDNGCGISEEVKKKIFTPNFTTKSSGMGLGLAIVKNIVLNTVITSYSIHYTKLYDSIPPAKSM